MDYIEDLPVEHEDATPIEMATAQKYLNSSGSRKKRSKITMKQTSWKDIIKWTVAVTLVFLLVSNPWFDKALAFVPTESPIILFGVKTAIFFILAFVVIWKFS